MAQCLVNKKAGTDSCFFAHGLGFLFFSYWFLIFSHFMSTLLVGC